MQGPCATLVGSQSCREEGAAVEGITRTTTDLEEEVGVAVPAAVKEEEEDTEEEAGQAEAAGGLPGA